MKTLKPLLSTLTVLVVLITTGCFDEFGIRGNGIAASEMRYTGTFSKVKSGGPFEVHISKNDEYKVIVNAETNLLSYIETDVEGSTLSIRIRGLHHVVNTLPMEIYISSPVLTSVDESGSGTITADYFRCNDFKAAVSGSGSVESAVGCINLDVYLSGSGTINLSGSAVYSGYNISGSGKIDGYDLASKECNAIISGSGDIYTNVERHLDATISGSGNVFFIGSPEISRHISGSGKIINSN